MWFEEPGGGSPFGADGTLLAEGTLIDRLRHRLRQITFTGNQLIDSMNYRIQLLAAARGGLSTAQRREVQSLFQEARTLLAAQFVDVQPAAEALPDPTKRAMQEAMRALEEDIESAPDATQKAVQDALRSIKESTEESMDSTRRVIMEAMKEAEASEDAAKQTLQPPDE